MTEIRISVNVVKLKVTQEDERELILSDKQYF